MKFVTTHCNVGAYIVLLLVNVNIKCGSAQLPFIVTTDELENHISAEDLRELLQITNPNITTTTAEPDVDYANAVEEHQVTTPKNYVDCFGLGSIARKIQSWFLNMNPESSDRINTHFYFISRQQRYRVQVYPGQQFGLEWVDFKSDRRTIMIVHGFMSHSNASWVIEMANAFLDWADVNVIAVDWSGGGNTWKYWRAVANTRTVGSDITGFLRQLMNQTGARTTDFHFVGHSLGAHICSYVAYRLGGISRITGLDPAQPCFITTDHTERLDTSDAAFVDVIHTNGRLLKKIGFGLPEPIGHADFYPNGGNKQPGCSNNNNSFWMTLFPSSITRLQQAVCSHGRAYLLFTESLINNNCSFRGHQWNLTYEGVNASLEAACDRRSSCAEMGIRAEGGDGLPKAKGAYFVLTTATNPYCPSEWERYHPWVELLRDLAEGFHLQRYNATTAFPDYADAMETTTTEASTTTTKNKWWWFG